jgi:hypothetical protein
MARIGIEDEHEDEDENDAWEARIKTLFTFFWS